MEVACRCSSTESRSRSLSIALASHSTRRISRPTSILCDEELPLHDQRAQPRDPQGHGRGSTTTRRACSFCSTTCRGISATIRRSRVMQSSTRSKTRPSKGRPMWFQRCRCSRPRSTAARPSSSRWAATSTPSSSTRERPDCSSASSASDAAVRFRLSHSVLNG